MCMVQNPQEWPLEDGPWFWLLSLLRFKKNLKGNEWAGTEKNSEEKYCCEHKSLINIEMDHAILDELHLLLRILDVLIET